MPLDSSLIEVPFAKGVDQKTEQRWVAVGTQTSVINGSWAKNGSLRKRLGSTSVPKQSISTAVPFPPALTAGAAVESYKGAPIVSDGSNLYSYSAAKNALMYEDQVPECLAFRTPLAQSTAGVISTDCAATNGYALYVYRASDVVASLKNYATIIDLSNGAQIGPNTVLDTSTNTGLRCIAVGSDLWAIWTDSGNIIQGSRFRTASTFAWEAPVPLVLDQDATGIKGVWDVCPIIGFGGGGFSIVYQGAPLGGSVTVRNFDVNGAPLANTSFTPVGAGALPLVGCAIRSTASDTCWVAYVTTNGATTDFVRSVGLNPSTLIGSSADSAMFSATPLANRHVGIEITGPGNAVIVSSLSTGDVQWVARVGASIKPVRIQTKMQMWSKPFLVGTKVFCIFWHYGDTINQSFHCVDLCVSNTASDNSVGRPVATIAPRIASSAAAMDALVSPNVVSIGNGQYLTAVTVSQSTSRDSVSQCLLDFATQQRHQSVELGDSLYVAGGVPSVFDGAQVTEHGFLYPPPSVSPVVNAGGSIDVGTHQYAIIYKRPNARGEMQRSAPLFSGIVTTSGGFQSVTLPVVPYGLTTGQDVENNWTPAATFDLYRNTVADPATFWQLKTDATETVSDPRTSTTVNLIDSASDSSIVSAAISVLYTLGNVLADQCPPSLTCLTTHKQRLFGAGDDGTVLWFTKQYVPGFVPGWNDQLTLSCPDGGPITGLASLDDSLVVFKADRIFRLYGTGPNNTGQQSDFSDFIRVASDTGCTQSRSIVLAPQGVFFMSPQGLYLLTRGGEVDYIGKAVEDTVAANPVCNAADIVASAGEIRWSLSATRGASTGVIIVYDYVQDAWSVHQYFDTDRGVASALAAGARAPGGKWAWLGSGGQLNIESPNAYLDGGSHWITLQVETAWIKAGGIGGWARFRRYFIEADQKTPFTFTLDAAVDLSGTYTQTLTWSDSQIAARGTALVELDLQIGNQKTQGVRFRLTDAPPTVAAVGTGQGPVLLGGNLEVALLPKGKGTRIPSVQRG